MTTRTKVHRASAQRRRAALLDAAVELSAEVGAGAVTHRAVAARAGVPLSTTSYFFSSIDELVTEALRVGARERIDDFDATERAAVEAEHTSVATVIGAAVDRALAASPAAEGSHVEYYLAAGRHQDLHDEASATVVRCAERVQGQFERIGAPQATVAAWAVTELADGALLHRVAGIDVDHRERLGAGLRLLVAAAMLRDDEIDALLARYEDPARHPWGRAGEPTPAAGA